MDSSDMVWTFEVLDELVGKEWDVIQRRITADNSRGEKLIAIQNLARVLTALTDLRKTLD